MPKFQIKKSAKSYDVCIVGSGAGGGMAAYVLANAGIKVLLLEAGPMYQPDKNVTQLKWVYESPRRGAGTTTRPFGDFDASYGGWEIEGEPYTHIKTEQSSTGFARVCWEVAPITGVEYHFALALKILNAKA